MRILFLSNLYPPNQVGGYEQLCFEVASGLAARGHQVQVLTSDYGSKVEDYPQQMVSRTLKLLATQGDIYQPFNCTPEQRAVMNRHNAEALKVAVEQFEPHIVFVWNLYFFDPSLLEAIKKIQLPTVYLLTDNWLISFANPAFLQAYFRQRVFNNQSFLKATYLNIKRRFRGWVKPDLLMRGHAIFPSHFMSDLYSEAGFGFDSKTIVYHGVDLSTYPRNGRTDRTRLLRDGELKLLVAGRIVEIKGVHTVLEALPPILRGLPDLKVRLTIRGDSRDQPYMNRLRAQAGQLGLENAVEFAAPAAQHELFDLFQSHDIYLFPSLYEPFALTLIQALAAGIPTAASNAGGNPEIVYNLKTGLLFPPGNAQKLAEAVIQLATKDELRKSLSDEAQMIANSYTSERMVGDIEQFLISVQQ
jgi:glycosyltransferase involved in cell wall biosynthesis